MSMNTNPTNEHGESAERFHPGVFIKEEIEARGWSVDTFVSWSNLTKKAAEELIAGHRKVTPVSALCLSQAFGTGPDLWINLQKSYDEWQHRPQTNAPADVYHEGDTVTVHHLIYPGPRPFTAEGRIVKCLSPTYYEVEYIDHRGKQCVKRFRRSQLP